jgi:hypothetical protein
MSTIPKPRAPGNRGPGNHGLPASARAVYTRRIMTGLRIMKGLPALVSRQRPASPHRLGPPAVRLLAVLLLALPGGAEAEPWQALRGLERVSLAIGVPADHPGPGIAELEARIRDALRRAERAPGVDPASPDRLHLGVWVGPVAAAELRGFWLPFSGTYAVGHVRLSVERQVMIPGVPSAMPAVVWQAERQASGPLRKAPLEIAVLVEDLLADFLQAYARAAAP